MCLIPKENLHRIFLITVVGVFMLFPIGVGAFLELNDGGFLDPGDQGFPDPGGGGPLDVSCGATPRTVSTGSSVQWFSFVSGGTGTYSYSWSGTDGLSGSVGTVYKTYTTVGTKTGQVTVSSGGQTVSEACGTVQVSAPAPAPTASLSANPTSIVAGNSTTISWNSSNATSCTGSGPGFSTGGTTSGSRSVSPSSNTTYSITCSGAGGSVYRAVSVSVTQAVATNLSIYPTSIVQGDSAAISWSSSNATSCTGSGPGFSTGGTTSGSRSVSPSSSTTYSVTCQNAFTSSTKSRTLTVTAPTPAPTASLSASPSSLTQGQYTTLSWSSTNASSCSGSGFNTSNRTSGTVTLSPNSTTNYSVTCTGSGGTASDSSRVTVTTPLPSSCTSGSRQTVSMTLYDTNNEASGIWGSASINSSYAPGETIRATGALWSDDYPRACPSLSINGTAFNLGCQLQMAPSKVLTVGTAPSTPGTYQMWWTVGNTGSYRVDRICPMTYTVVAPAPTASLSASPSSITQGDSTRLSWSSSNATSCTGSGFSTSNRTSGSVTVSPSSTRDYGVSCTGSGGSDSDTTRVTVNDPPPAPTASLSASPSSITRGDSSTLSWSSTAASFCTGTGFNTSNRTSGSVTVSPSSTTNYSITCSGIGGSDSDTAGITVNDPAPTASLSASPSSITQGDSTRLSWSSSNATSCTGSGFSTSNRTSGSVTVSPSSTTNYSVRCSSTGGSDSDSARVNVSPPPPEPTASLSTNPSTIIRGNSSTISWSSEDATGCIGSGFSTGGATSGSRTISPPTSRNYSVTCSGPGGSDSDTAGITVNDPAPTASLSASPSSITRGETVRLSWSSSNATRCSGDGQDGFYTNARTSGSLTITPTGSKTYTISCTGPGGGASDGVYVSVSNPAPTASLSASPSSITQGDSTRLSWSSTNATRCSGDGQDGFYTNARTSGSVNITPSSSQTYTVTCEGYGGEEADSASVTISAQCSDGIDNDGDGLIDYPDDPGCFGPTDNDEYNPPPQASISLSASPNPARTNETARISWTARNVESGSCRLTGTNGDVWNLSGTRGSRTSSTLTEEVTYTLRCTDLEDEVVEERVEVKLTPIFREI